MTLAELRKLARSRGFVKVCTRPAYGVNQWRVFAAMPGEDSMTSPLAEHKSKPAARAMLAVGLRAMPKVKS